jgi:hypothetical protein
MAHEQSAKKPPTIKETNASQKRTEKTSNNWGKFVRL